MKARNKAAGVLLLAGSLLPSHAQTVPALSKRAAAAKGKVDRLSPQAHISVIPITGNEEFGNFLSHDGESFTFYDVDQKTPVTFRYAAVKTLRNGYGGYGFQHRHVDRHNQTIIVAVVLGGLVALIGAAAAAK